MEHAQNRVPAHGVHGAEEQDGAHTGAASANEALAAPSAGLTREGRKTGERGNLAATETAELWDLGQHGSCNDGSDTRDGSQQVLLLAPSRRTSHGLVQVGIERS